MESVNPATGEIVATYQEMNSQELGTIVQEADEAQSHWRRRSFEERAVLLRKVADLLESNKEKYAGLMAREMGKPLPQGKSESEKCAWVCRYYADHAEQFLENEMIESDADKSYITYNPLGTVLAIMPWNFPFWQLFRFAAPALMAGNAAVLKHASNVTGCALAIEELMHEAGIPEPLFRTLVAGSDRVEQVISDEHIAAVTLTGSTRAGKAVASTAGSLVKKTVLELGGSDPYLILADADIEQAAETCVTSRLINGGQSCIAAKRFIVVEDNYDLFIENMTTLMKEKRMGDPFEDDVDLGPMARADLRDELHEQVRQSVDAGAECILGGEISDRKGTYYPPTILTNVTKGMPAYEEELFGPVASVIRVKDEQEAIRVANDSDFGLGAAVFSRDADHAERIAAEELEAGCCFVNAFVKSDPRLPFGGVKQSGYGRELSHLGIREFVNIKTVYRA
ncbi:succinate-semialdehyde dehydrogenase / glutarate-semialdehyde dehydrogenase [Fodinibius roseus]|uniref:Succinate-semialdehyde dehydrogenase / glutarate-semialdehyde dehydrogenase n=1 Tax=Fodinibius roseus TaxID=1194090 RepID=A0A1M4XRQ5_9BACT|nr:NAD-dependent succinate-semialdehyde dehydrogenase [Fodinibius roseus]SHE96128.1 succinate-semialdehyde dehydrogenase / glutarate-semialdehyde dehydrogenase [Fodinibius roseus]